MRLFLLLLFASLHCTAYSSKLNVPRVLLPASKSHAPTFTLEVKNNGCYKWTLSRTDIVQLIPLNEDNCSTKASIYATPRELTRSTAIVLVEEVSTNEILRCDVIIDVISSLEIVTTTRELYLEEAPVNFEVRAYDDKGNEFSTLEGVEFLWTINGYSHIEYMGTRNDNALKFISFSDSTYDTTDESILELERRGSKGHIVLLEGVKTGTAKLTVQLKQQEYRHLPPAEVQLNVLANLLIEPSNVWMIKDDIIVLNLIQIRSGKLVNVDLTSQQYTLKLENDKIVKFIKPWVLKAFEIGSSKVSLHDRNSREQDASYLPSSSISVAIPSHINLVTLPYGTWSTSLHQPITIAAELFDNKNNKLYMGPTVNIEIQFDHNFIETKDVAQNGSYVTGTTIKEGVTRIKAIYKGGGSEELIAVADLHIYPKITIERSDIVIAWHPKITPKTDVALNPVGGDGSYEYTSKDKDVVTVTKDGLLRGHKIGNTEIIISMKVNPSNFIKINVFVAPPSQLDILNTHVKSNVNEPIYLDIALTTKIYKGGYLRKALITNCMNFPLKISTSNDYLYFNSTTQSTQKDACISVVLTSAVNAVTEVIVSYEEEEISDKAIVFTYYKLTVDKSDLLLTLGSSWFVTIQGGTGIERNIETTSPNIDFKIITQDSIMITCMKIGHSRLIINEETVKAESLSVNIKCDEPKSIQLTIDNDQCPKLIALNDNDLKIKMKIKNNDNAIFDNATSLNIMWSLSNPSLGVIINPDVIYLNKEEKEIDHYQILKTKKTGNLKIKCTIVGYKPFIINNQPASFATLNEITKSKGKLVIDSEISLQIVDNLFVNPNKISIFNHPNNIKRLFITNGSGYYKIKDITSGGEDEVAEIKYEKNIIDIKPIKPGSMKFNVIDICIPKSITAQIEINVITIKYVKLNVRDKIGVNEKVNATLDFLDAYDNPIDLNISILNIRWKIVKSNIVTINDNKNGIYEIVGLKHGETEIITIVQVNDEFIESQSILIKVYDPLELIPGNVTLIPGSIFQVKVKGGPQSDYMMEYHTSNDEIIKISHQGLIEALNVMGEVEVYASAIAFDKVKGEKIIYTTGKMNVNVVYLQGIRINAPLKKIATGSKMPIWIEGIPSVVTPLALGSVQSTKFKWFVSSPDVIKLDNVFADAMIQVEEEDQLSMRIKTLKEGNCVIRVQVTLPANVAQHVDYFTDEISILVYDHAKLINPSLDTNNLILSTNINFQLKTNKDKTKEVIAKKVYSNGVLNVTENGLVKTNHVHGDEIVVLSFPFDSSNEPPIYVPIEVRPTNYFMLNLKADFKINGNVMDTTLPRGMKLEYYVTYHDNIGREFTAVGSNLRVELNRNDLLEVSEEGNNSTVLYVHLTSTGRTVWKVSDVHNNMHQMENYVKFPTSSMIYPHRTRLTVGDVLCFSNTLKPVTNEPCYWMSTNEESLQINSITGLAIAKKKQENVIIRYVCSKSVIADTVVRVLPLYKIDIIGESTDLNITDDGREHHIPLKLMNEVDWLNNVKRDEVAISGDCEKDSANIDKYLPYKCESIFRSSTQIDIFETYAHFVLEKGVHTCTLKSKSKVVGPLKADVSLKITWDKQYLEQTLNFHPGVVIKEKEIFLTNDKPEDYVHIAGTQDVLRHVTAVSSKESLYIGTPELKQNSLKYSISVTRPFWSGTNLNEKFYVEIMSPLTGQEIKIPVVVKVELDSSCSMYSSADLVSYFVPFFLILSTMVACYVASIWYKKLFEGKTPYAVDNNITWSPSFNESFNHDRSFNKSKFITNDDTRMVYGLRPRKLTPISKKSMY